MGEVNNSEGTDTLEDTMAKAYLGSFQTSMMELWIEP